MGEFRAEEFSRCRVAMVIITVGFLKGLTGGGFRGIVEGVMWSGFEM